MMTDRCIQIFLFLIVAGLAAIIIVVSITYNSICHVLKVIILMEYLGGVVYSV